MDPLFPFLARNSIREISIRSFAKDHDSGKERKKEEVVEEEEEEERTKGNRGGIGDRTWQVFQGLRFGRKI